MNDMDRLMEVVCLWFGAVIIVISLVLTVVALLGMG
jgi:hypothetical protein